MRAQLLALLLVLTAGCTQANDGVVAYVGATLIDGTGAAAISDAVLVVEAGRVTDVGPAAEVRIPRGATEVNVSGRFIMPGIVNAHAHVGDTRGLEAGHYSEANVLDQLQLFARYGITTVVSLGDDQEAGVRVRDAQAVPSLDRARLFVAGAVVTGDTPGEAVAIAEANAEMGVDFIKFRVDDNLGTTEKMPPDVYRAVIAKADQLGLPVAAHVHYLADTKDLLRAGIDFVGHSVRDLPVDAELIGMLRESGACYCATLMREVSTYVYESEPEFFHDPFFLAEADSTIIETLLDPVRQEAVRQNRAAQLYKAALETAKRNLALLSEGGVRIAMGTDAGPPARFQGYFEHLELEMMADVGMSTPDVIRAATGEAAACMGLEDIGTLEVGNWADFLVLGADPLTDIKNTRSIEQVYIAGNEVPRGEDRAQTSR
jgi:imidazolonepropionase-like amidohydrolase